MILEKLNVPAGITFEEPVRLKHESKIVVEQEGEATVLIDEAQDRELTIEIGKQGKLRFVEIQTGDQKITKTFILEEGAQLDHVVVSLDGNSIEVNEYNLVGEGASVKFNQAILCKGNERQVKVKAIHSAPFTESKLSTRSVALDNAKIVSQGKVFIDQNAKNSISDLTDHGLVIGEASSINIPSMEVIANEVQAGHSASTSQISEENLFYLMSRGLSEEKAKKEIVIGFLESVVDFDIRELIEQRLSGNGIDAINRGDFPVLDQEVHGRSLVYLDSAATSQKPIQVIEAVQKFYSEDNANIHRGLHTLSERATEKYEQARSKVAKFVSAKMGELIFVRNATEGLNLLANTMGRKYVGAGDTILLTEMEHHSNIIPWQLIAKQRGASVRYVKVNNDGTLDMDSLKFELKKQPKVLALTHISNVLGTINPIKEITALAHQNRTMVVVDAAQSVPHIPVDVRDLDCDAMVFSGHKMLGPTGIGAVYIREELLKELPPYMSGGGMIKEVTLEGCTFKEGPEKYEAGTPNIAGAIGMAAAVDYLQRVGMYNIARHNTALLGYALGELEKMPQVKLYGPGAAHRAGAIAFNLGDMHAHDVSTVLDEYGVAVRAGHHCAQPLMDCFKADSMCRASIHLYNNKEDIDRFISALKEAIKIFRLSGTDYSQERSISVPEHDQNASQSNQPRGYSDI